MINLRCSEELSSRLDIDGNVNKNKKISTNILGDWFADFFTIGRKQYVIFINEITSLAVVTPFKNFSYIYSEFSSALAGLLELVGISRDKIDFELSEIKDINYIISKNTSLAGRMKESIDGINIWFLTEPDGSISELNLYLAGLLAGPFPFRVPREKVSDLFHVKKEEVTFFQIDKLCKK